MQAALNAAHPVGMDHRMKTRREKSPGLSGGAGVVGGDALPEAAFSLASVMQQLHGQLTGLN
jgi:hypothetical protein